MLSVEGVDDGFKSHGVRVYNRHHATSFNSLKLYVSEVALRGLFADDRAFLLLSLLACRFFFRLTRDELMELWVHLALEEHDLKLHLCLLLFRFGPASHLTLKCLLGASPHLHTTRAAPAIAMEQVSDFGKLLFVWQRCGHVVNV